MVTTTLMTLILTLGGGVDAAAAVCSDLFFDSDKRACLAQITGDVYIDQNAAQVCGSLFFDSDKTNCIATIKNKSYSPTEVSTCGDMFFDSDKTKCLATTGRQQYQRSDHHRRDRYDRHDRRDRYNRHDRYDRYDRHRSHDHYRDVEAGAQICSSLYFDSDKRACLVQLRGAQYVDAQAAAVCQSIYFDSDKTRCLAAIIDKRFARWEVSICGDNYFDSDKIACFKEGGSVSRRGRCHE